jgi:hypothetical protein
MLLVTSFVLIVLTTPVCVYLLVQQGWKEPRGTAVYERRKLLGSVLRALCDVNHAVNFYLYFVR